MTPEEAQKFVQDLIKRHDEHKHAYPSINHEAVAPFLVNAMQQQAATPDVAKEEYARSQRQSAEYATMRNTENYFNQLRAQGVQPPAGVQAQATPMQPQQPLIGPTGVGRFDQPAPSVSPTNPTFSVPHQHLASGIFNLTQDALRTGTTEHDPAILHLINTLPPEDRLKWLSYFNNVTEKRDRDFPRKPLQERMRELIGGEINAPKKLPSGE